MLRFIDGFDHGVNTYSGKWDSGAEANSAGAGRFANPSGPSAACTVGNEITKQKTIDDQAHWIVGFAIFRRDRFWATWFDSAGSSQVNIECENDGSIAIFRGGTVGDGTLLQATATGLLPASEWHYLEFDVVIDNAGSWLVRLDGVPILSGTGDTQATSVASARKFGFRGILGGDNLQRIDDLYIADGQAGRVTAPIGDVRVETQMPTGDGDFSNWTPLTGPDHWQMVDESPPDGDTSYNSESTVNDRDSYTHGAFPTVSGTVWGVQVCPAVRKDDAGTRGAKPFIRQGGVTADGPETLLVTTYRFLPYLRETDPSGSNWTIATANSAQPGQVVST